MISLWTPKPRKANTPRVRVRYDEVESVKHGIALMGNRYVRKRVEGKVKINGLGMPRCVQALRGWPRYVAKGAINNVLEMDGTLDDMGWRVDKILVTLPSHRASHCWKYTRVL